MRRLYASLLVLAGSLAFGQSTIEKNPPGSASTSVQNAVLSSIPFDNSLCPVGFYASRQAGGQILNASDGKRAGAGQGLHLVLDPLSNSSIESIEVTVYATSLKAMVLPAANRSSGPDTVSKTFSLERKAGSNGLGEADIWMQQVGSVRWADLVSITFTDGTTWHSTENLGCRAVPSNLLLVGRR